jgi:hypothetical protein
VVATLLELGADMRARNAAGNTPAHTAALNGHVEAMEEFMSSGFDVKTTNGRGQTVLHLAAVATKVPIHWLTTVRYWQIFYVEGSESVTNSDVPYSLSFHKWGVEVMAV